MWIHIYQQQISKAYILTNTVTLAIHLIQSFLSCRRFSFHGTSKNYAACRFLASPNHAAPNLHSIVTSWSSTMKRRRRPPHVMLRDRVPMSPRSRTSSILAVASLSNRRTQMFSPPLRAASLSLEVSIPFFPLFHWAVGTREECGAVD